MRTLHITPVELKITDKNKLIKQEAFFDNNQNEYRKRLSLL